MTDSSALVTENLGLVHMCVRKFSGRGQEYEDLFQTGCLGLVKAAENYDDSRGIRFSTYAVTVIIGELRSSFRSGGLLRVSRGLRELSARAAKAESVLQERLGRSPSVSELSKELDMPAEKVSEALMAFLPLSSLSRDDDSAENEIPDSADGIDRLTEKLTLRQCVEKLDEEDRRLIELRYCLSKTQRETAELLGSNQVQISRREKKILLFLRGVLL